MGDFRMVKSLAGDLPELRKGTADQALEDGDLGHIDGDGEVDKLANAAAEKDMVLVVGDASANGDVYYYPLNNMTVIEGTSTTTSLEDVGDFVGVHDTAGVLSFESGAGTFPERFQVYKIIDATAKTIQCVFASGHSD